MFHLPETADEILYCHRTNRVAYHSDKEGQQSYIRRATLQVNPGVLRYFVHWNGKPLGTLLAPDDETAVTKANSLVLHDQHHTQGEKP